MRGFQCIILCAALLYTTSAFGSCGNDGSDGPDNAECDGYSGDSCTSLNVNVKEASKRSILQQMAKQRQFV